MEEMTLMKGVTEYNDINGVKLVRTRRKIVGGMPCYRWVILAQSDDRSGETQVDVLEPVDWLKKNRPDLLV